MAAPDLTGRTISATYKDLLQVSNSNAGVDGTSRAVQDGAGDVSAMELSTTGVKSTGTLDVTGNTTLSGNLTLGTTTSVSAVKDEDDLGGGSSSSSSLATQQSIKAYVDEQVGEKDHLSELAGDSDDVSEGGTNRYVTTDQEDALAGTNGTPNSSNPFVTNTDSRLTDSRNPDGAAGGDLSGTYPNPTVAQLQGRDMASTAPSDGQVIKWNNSSSQWEPAADSTGSGGGGGLDNVSEDTTPQLGGNLDVNTYSLVSVSDGNIPIAPDGSGKVVLDGLSWPVADGDDGDVLKTDGAGNLSFSAESGGGGGGDTLPIADTTAVVKDPSDATKLVRIDAGAVGTGTTKVITMGDRDVNLASGGTFAENSHSHSYQPADAQLDDLAGLAVTDSNFIVGDGTNWVAESGATARTSLGVDAAGTDNSTAVTLDTTSYDYLSLTGQEIALGQVNLTSDVTGAAPVANGGTGLSAITSGHVLYASGANTIAAAALGSASGVQAYDAETAKTDTAQTWTKAQIPATQTAAFSSLSSGVLDFDSYQNFVITLGSGTNAFTNPSTDSSNAGQTGVIVLIQDSSASTATWGTQYKVPAGTAPTLSSGSAAVDILPYCIQADDNILIGAPQLNMTATS